MVFILVLLANIQHLTSPNTETLKPNGMQKQHFTSPYSI